MKESVKEFLARGGEITEVPIGESGINPLHKRTAKEQRNKMRSSTWRNSSIAKSKHLKDRPSYRE